jgi:hypothetical protein
MRPLVQGQRSDAQRSIAHAPDQRRWGEDFAIQLSALPFRVVVEHLPFSGRRPPAEHPVSLRQHVLRENLCLRFSAERAYQRLHKCCRQRLSRPQVWRPSLLCTHGVSGDEGAIVIFCIDQKCFTPARSDASPRSQCSRPLPSPQAPISSTSVNSSTLKATNLLTAAQAGSNSARLSGANTTHRVGSEEASSMCCDSSSKQATMAS